MKTIYLSGKISNNLDYHSEFNAAKSTLSAQKYEVVDPREICADISADSSWEDYMIRNLKALSLCDAIYMLRSWHSSPGAKIEHAWAERTGKIIKYE